MSRARVLIVDDEANARRALRTLLEEDGYEVAEAGDGVEGLEQLTQFAPAVVLSDVRMPRMDGIELLERARETGQDAAFVMMTAFGSVEQAVRAMRLGAENFLLKPLDVSAVTAVLDKVLERRALVAETALLRERVRERFHAPGIVGQSSELRSVMDVVERTAPTRATLLILGESGTGKELVAQALHEASPRRERRFVKVHCAALSESLLESELFGHEKGAFTGATSRREGRFELADGGTLFLDEVGEIPAAVQVKLLRVLQEREFERVGGSRPIKVDVRLVAATHRDLAAEVLAGRFREDLFYRLNVVSVTLPPLRRRKGDIPALVDRFVEKFSRAYGKTITGLAPGTLEALSAHDWPGNIRELENVIERAVVLCRSSTLGAEDLPLSLRATAPVTGTDGEPGALVFKPGMSLAELERRAIEQTLQAVGGSTGQAARLLGISIRKVQYRVREYAASRHGGDLRS